MFHQANMSNRLLSLMSTDDFGLILPNLEPVDLPRSFVFSEANREVDYCYFMQSGIGSMVAVSPEGQRAEVGLFGRDGMTPTLGGMDAGSSPHDIFVQVAGNGVRLKTGILEKAVASSPSMQKVFLRYNQAFTTQAGFTALSNAVHQVDERLARWILMCHDRTDGNTIELTHEFLSVMLAVRRPSVTSALHVLEGNRLITAARGSVTIRDRQALEAFAGDAYGRPEEEYRKLLGTM